MNHTLYGGGIMIYTSTSKPRVLVLGLGFGGLESAFYVKWKLKNRVDLTIIAPTDQFLFKPNTIYIPFGADPKEFVFSVRKGMEKRGIRFLQGKAVGIDPELSLVETTTTEGKIPYDYLIIATGAGMQPEDIPGLEDYAHTVWTPQAMLRLREGYQKVRERLQDGKTQHILFLVPPHNKCSGPLYEIVFMTDTWFRRQKLRDRLKITWTTFEKGYIQAFGPRLNEVVEKEFARRNIEGIKQVVVKEVKAQRVLYENGMEIEYDLLVSFPPYRAEIKFDTLPADERGFISTYLPTRQVQGYENIYVAGDTGDFPVKQAFLAFLQADAGAEHLSSRILKKQPDFAFEPVSMCIMEQFDHATFAQVPLEFIPEPQPAVQVAEDMKDLYKVGVSPVWRIGKKMLGVYLPWRFKNGLPFHAGTPWKAMEIGMKLMSGLLAK